MRQVMRHEEDSSFANLSEISDYEATEEQSIAIHGPLTD